MTTSIEQSFRLPSNGVLYGGAIPPEVTLRAMTTKEEKIRLNSTGMESMVRTIKACVASPENLDIYSLKIMDLFYLMYMLRITTYGGEYHVPITCSCGNHFTEEVDLSELKVNYVEDDFEESFDIGPLPVSGDTLTCKIQSVNDYLTVQQMARKIMAKAQDKNNVTDPSFSLERAFTITHINGEDATAKRQMYVDNMNMKDLRFFDARYQEMTGNYGIDNTIMTECQMCGNTFNVIIPRTEEFFRPEI